MARTGSSAVTIVIVVDASRLCRQSSVFVVVETKILA